MHFLSKHFSWHKQHNNQKNMESKLHKEHIYVLFKCFCVEHLKLIFTDENAATLGKFLVR